MEDHLQNGWGRRVSEIRLCALDEIDEGGSAGFIAEFEDNRMAVLAVRQGDEAFVYENSCPHIGAPLDFQPGQFLNVERTHIICSTHGALFQIHDGHCISGPCEGDHLTPLPASVRDGSVYVSAHTS